MANHLPTTLKNHYFLMRHGKSKANELGIILSHPDDGVPDYGLVEEGRTQVRRSAEAALQQHLLDSNTIILSSDFSRTKETAEVAEAVLGTESIILEPRLRERFFGTWDKQPSSAYQKVWDNDRAFPGHKHNQVESTEEVLARTTALIQNLETTYTGKNILLVSHGDALQILQTAFEGVTSHLHRNLTHLETAEIRQMS